MSDVNSKKYVWIVSYTLNNEPMVAAFEDKTDAEQCKQYFEDKGYTCYLDQCEVVQTKQASDNSEENNAAAN